MARQRAAPRPTRPEKPADIETVASQALALRAAGDFAGAIRLYREWLGGNRSPHAWIVQYNLAVLLKETEDDVAALEAYEVVLRMNPGFAPAFVNLGYLHARQGRNAQALAAWTEALRLLDASPASDRNEIRITLNNLGNTLEQMGRLPEALAMLTRSLGLEPDQEYVLYHWIYLRQQLCEWPLFSPLPGIPVERMREVASALVMVAVSDDPALQLQSARRNLPQRDGPAFPRLAPVSGYAHDRLRIGYLSSNFGSHAVSVLTAELYELHDRSRFEIFGFCWSPEDNSDMRLRVRQAMDQFIRIDRLSDEAAAQAIRAAEIDILIDLQGQTHGARPDILAYRPAPVQIAYLGYPATSAMPEIDYVLADRYVVPEEAARHFSEKLLYLPDCFQVNDRKRIAEPPLSRREYDLPDDAFVFCSFNKTSKLNPECFSAWMRILKRTPHSVLWLLANHDQTRENLVRYAEAQGIARERLIFGPRLARAKYLARYAAADLFLDITPFNGGTTVSDALWMGLPVLTCSGRSFASRMGGSLLNAIGLPELVTTSLADYEELAVALAADPQRYREIKARLLANKNSYPIFDTPRFVRNLEAVFERTALRPPQNPPVAPVAPVRRADDFFSEREIYFVVYTPAFQRSSGGVYAMHALAEDMYARGCNVGVLASAGMPGARAPLIAPTDLENVRAAGMMIVAIYPEIVTENVLRADYAVWWLLSYPGLIKGNWNGSYDWADRVVCFGREMALRCRCDAVLAYPLYDPDLFFPNAEIPQTEISYYVNRIFGVAETIQCPVAPTQILNPANNLSYKQLRQALWRSKVVVANEWSGTLIIARLCGIPVIHLPSPLLSPDIHNTDEHMLGAAWGYSEQNIEAARQSLAPLHLIHRNRKDTWLRSLADEVSAWVSGVKKKS